MIPSLSQEELTQYASNAQTIQEPTGLDYSQGAKAGRTIPAKWWNWLFSNVTKRIVQSRNDADDMLTELKNVVTNAGLTPSGEDYTQLRQAIDIKADRQIERFVANKKNWGQYWGEAQLIIDGVAYDPTQYMHMRSIFYGDNIITIKARFGINAWFDECYSFDGIHWQTIQGLPSLDDTGSMLPVYVQGALFILCAQGNGTVSDPARLRVYYKNLATADNAIKIIDLSYNGLDNYYDCLCTVINDELYIMTCTGELIKLTGNSGTYTTVTAATGLGQAYVPTGDIHVAFAEAHHFNNKFYVGNIEVSEDALSWTPLYNSSSASTNAASTYTKQLAGGCIAFVRSDRTAVILNNAHELINLPAGDKVFLCDRNVDTFLVIGDDNTSTAITYDGVNFISCYFTRGGNATEVNALILGEADGVTYAIAEDSVAGYHKIISVRGTMPQDFDFRHASDVGYFRHYDDPNHPFNYGVIHSAFAVPDSSIVSFSYYDARTNVTRSILIYQTWHSETRDELPVVRLLNGDTLPFPDVYDYNAFPGRPFKHTAGIKNYGIIGERLYTYASASDPRHIRYDSFIYTSKTVNVVVGHTLYLR